jgi:lipopolysaccharide export LptBFGC system permease protein LptF
MLTDKQVEQLKEVIKQTNIKILNLREAIKNDVEEYNLFRQTPYISGNKFNFYREYLLEQIEQNIEELKELMEKNNE